MQKTLSFTLDRKKQSLIFQVLKDEGVVVPSTNEYVVWHIKGSGFSAILYTSGKFVFQVKDVSVEGKVLEILDEAKGFKPHIGSDEVGKGDYFGPLVICACFLDEDDLKKIEGLGITDSKRIKDVDILRIGKFLEHNVRYEVKIISPIEYNGLVEELKNVSIILAKGHVEVITKLVQVIGEKSVAYVVVDQFSKSKNRLDDVFDLSLKLHQYHHAESDVAVACASVLARYFFLLEFEKLNKKYGFKFPLGATHVIGAGKDFVKEFGFESLSNVAKISFRTTESI